MIDLIIKTISDFQTTKHTFKHCPIIDNKYTILFNKYECFFDKKDNKTYKDNHIYTFKHKKPLKTTSARDECSAHRSFHQPKSIEKTLIGILNIINTSNYDKNLNKIRITSTGDNVELITNEILLKCCLQIFYLKIFVKLIKDMIALSGYKDIIDREIGKFCGLFTKDKNEYIFKKEKLLMSDYDYFCVEQKHKVYASSKNLLILELYKEDILSLDIDVYFKHFCHEITDASVPSDIDIILHILMDIVKQCNNVITFESKTYLGTILSTIKIENKKIHFMIQEILVDIAIPCT